MVLQHLFELPILALPFLRPLRLLSLAVVINVLQRAIGHTIRGRVIVYTACGAVPIVYAASLAIIDVESDLPTSIQKSIAWRRAVVGDDDGDHRRYGDLSPAVQPRAGCRRGVDDRRHHLAGSITATLASWIVQRVAEEDTAQQAATAAHIDDLREEIRRLTEVVNAQNGATPGEQVEGNG